MSITLKLDYTTNSSELCLIGKKYDTDKSSQRSNVTNTRHCHPYTLFYESLFRNKRNDEIKIAELGILDGASLLMWREYFANASIYGFEYNDDLLAHFKKTFNNDRITLAHVDVTSKRSIIKAFSEMSVFYDIIIEDTTHQFEDQIRVIENAYQCLKPGGILIIEDIFKSYKEADYLTRLNRILHHFQDYYFVELEHEHRNSTGWDNDKLFVLVKAGAPPIFQSANKVTIITPSYRVNNLPNLKRSIDFRYVDEWIIVYDGRKIKENPLLFGNDEPKIKEHVYLGDGTSGNPQRNYALTKVTNPTTVLYYLDDDNIVHPNLYRLLNILDNTKMYTFNQENKLKGNNVNVRCIDTAMALIPYHACQDEKWIPDLYEADGYYITECYKKNRNKHVFVDNGLCYYNQIGV